MNLLETAEVKGFWGSKHLVIDFHPGVNFLIGVNGAGKTTLINMIAATLNADFVALDRLPFKTISLKFRQIDGNRRPSIEVEKKSQQQAQFYAVKFQIKNKASAKPVVYSLDHDEERRLLRRYPSPSHYILPKGVTPRGVIEHIRNLVNFSWLSIHRTPPSPSRSDREQGYESTIDQKLAELSNEFVRYFSLLSRQSADETEKFQETIFLSLISGIRESEIFSSSKKLDLEAEKKALIEIFQLFGLKEQRFGSRVGKHYLAVSKAVDCLEKREGISAEEFASLVETWRIHSIVQQWKRLSEKRDLIFQPRDMFLDVLNNLMSPKRLQINDKNELEVFTKSEKMLSLRQLSSGEKQLLILLGEALLQEKAPWIYIADEPELSLHIKWQEGLIRTLRKINPRAQVIFATHSPDIVSQYGDRVFDMEKILK